jgi:pyruvate formate lyase activating enzyme
MSRSRDIEAACQFAQPKAIAEAALRHGCHSVAFTYNDPIVWAEYAIDTARECRAVGVKTVAVTSGYITDIARPAFFEEMDAANVDLKGFSEDFYRHYCAGHLQPVLDTLEWIVHEGKTWLEITNLIIPGANDDLVTIEAMCRWIVEKLGQDVPLHFSAFHPDFQLTDRRSTPVSTLIAAYEIAKKSGVRYVYTGNALDPEHQQTYCSNCGKIVISRHGYSLGDFALHDGRCTYCQTSIAGHFDNQPGDWGGQRMPVTIENTRVS